MVGQGGEVITYEDVINKVAGVLEDNDITWHNLARDIVNAILGKGPLYTSFDMREAFVAGAYWGMDNPFGLDTVIPQSEAIRRWPDKEER
jgi:hypothetical protein